MGFRGFMQDTFNWFSITITSDGKGGSTESQTLNQSFRGNLQYAKGTKQVFAGGKAIIYDYRIITDRLYDIKEGDLIDNNLVLHVERWQGSTMKATIIYVTEKLG